MGKSNHWRDSTLFRERVIRLVHELGDDLKIEEFIHYPPKLKMIIRGTYKSRKTRIEFHGAPGTPLLAAVVEVYIAYLGRDVPAAFIECMRECVEEEKVHILDRDSSIIIAAPTSSDTSADELRTVYERLFTHEPELKDLLSKNLNALCPVDVHIEGDEAVVLH